MTTAYDTFVTANIPTWPETSVQNGVIAMFLLSYMDDAGMGLEEVHYYLSDSQMVDFIKLLEPQEIIGLSQTYDWASVPAGVQTILDAIPAYREALLNSATPGALTPAAYAGSDTMMIANLANINPESQLMVDMIVGLALLKSAALFDDGPLTAVQRILDRPYNEKLDLFKMMIVDRQYEYVGADATYTALLPTIQGAVNEFEQPDSMPNVGNF